MCHYKPRTLVERFARSSRIWRKKVEGGERRKRGSLMNGEGMEREITKDERKGGSQKARGRRDKLNWRNELSLELNPSAT